MNIKIADIAKSYIGKNEVPGNMGFTDKVFEKKMIDVGFVKSWAWCALFLELCVKEGNPDFYKLHEKLFSASATSTYKNFDIAKKTKQLPSVGDGVIWRFGNGWQGHAGIVISITDDGFYSIEGNTNAAGGREGIEVARKKRLLKTPYSPKGLNLVGFIDFT